MKILITALLFCSFLFGQRFASIGDYGDDNSNELAVANLVKSWNPDFVITLGDNNYNEGLWETIDNNIGQYYHEFIFPYVGTYGQGSDINRFFPCPGNHDHNNANLLQPYLDYFDLIPYSTSSGNERYYDFVWGNIHFFSVNSCTMEPDGYTHPSVQSAWLEAQLANCDSNHSHWKVVYFHHAAYSSGQHGSQTRMQWPFKEWGADVVMSGHDHTYERIIIDDLLYFVNGLGGKSQYSFDPPIPGSEVRYNDKYGAMLMEADEFTFSFSFFSVDSELIDYYQLVNPFPATPGNLTAQIINEPLSVELMWIDNSVNEEGFVIERALTNPNIFEVIDTVGADITGYLDTTVTYSTYSYRIKAFNLIGDSPYSDTVQVEITDPLPQPPGNLTALVIYEPLSVELMWTDKSNNEDGFVIERELVNSEVFEVIDTVGADLMSYLDTTASYASYTYRIKAFNEFGNSPYSDTVQVEITDPLPQPPGNLIAQIFNEPLSVELTWTDNSNNEDGFVIERDLINSENFEIVDTVGADVTGYVDTTIAYATYIYRIKAYNQFGDSPYSDTAEVIVPVELVSFEAHLVDNTVLLEWVTASELNNMGFEVQKQLEDSWSPIVFIKGQGNSVTNHKYEYSDNRLLAGNFNEYRLKQIDYNGTFSFSNSVEVFVPARQYTLEQNFPNPFNPRTTIRFKIPEDGMVSIKLYDLFGQEVKTLLNEYMKADKYEINVEADGLSSGVYFYKMQTKNFSESKKMILLK